MWCCADRRRRDIRTAGRRRCGIHGRNLVWVIRTSADRRPKIRWSAASPTRTLPRPRWVAPTAWTRKTPATSPTKVQGGGGRKGAPAPYFCLSPAGSATSIAETLVLIRSTSDVVVRIVTFGEG